MAELIDRQLLNVRQAVGRRRRAPARLWRAPTIRIMTASGGTVGGGEGGANRPLFALRLRHHRHRNSGNSSADEI